MASVLHRLTKQYLRSVNTPDYPEADWIINPDLSVVDGIASEEWVIAGDTVRPMNGAEKAAALPDKKLTVERRVAGAASEYGKSKFPVEHELKLKMLYQEAVATGKTNRAAYIQQALVFEQAVVAEMQSRIAAVRSAPDWDSLMAVSDNFSVLDNQVPAVTVAGALEVTD